MILTRADLVIWIDSQRDETGVSIASPFPRNLTSDLPHYILEDYETRNPNRRAEDGKSFSTLRLKNLLN